MNNAIQRTKWTSVGLLLALMCGAPAVADDTELLLINPNEDTQTTPNVLLIIDSSGSMGSNDEQTREVYDSAQVYVGQVGAECDPNYLYWTPFKDVRPSCANDTYRILKTSFVCAAATRQINGIGIYRDTMAQFRAGDSGIIDILKNLVGGELRGYTELLTESRRQAIERMMAQAQELGANAVVNVMTGGVVQVIDGVADVLAATDHIIIRVGKLDAVRAVAKGHTAVV